MPTQIAQVERLREETKSTTSAQVLRFIQEKCRLLTEMFEASLPTLVSISEFRISSGQQRLKRSSIESFLTCSRDLKLKQRIKNLLLLNEVASAIPELKHLELAQNGFEYRLTQFLSHLEDTTTDGNKPDRENQTSYYERLPHLAYGAVQDIRKYGEEIQKIRALATARLGGINASLAQGSLGDRGSDASLQVKNDEQLLHILPLIRSALSGLFKGLRRAPRLKTDDHNSADPSDCTPLPSCRRC
jgi:hypothetical protein